MGAEEYEEVGDGESGLDVEGAEGVSEEEGFFGGQLEVFLVGDWF